MNRWDELSLKEKSQLLGIYASKGYTDLASIISHYNTFQAGGPVPSKTPNFVQRFKEGNKRDIPVKDGFATHLLSYAERDGRYYVYPEVQPTDYNDSNSPLQYYGRDWRVAFDRAYDNNDYLEFDTEEAARNYSENYKKVPSTGAVLNGRNRGNYNILDYIRGYQNGGPIKPNKIGYSAPPVDSSLEGVSMETPFYRPNNPEYIKYWETLPDNQKYTSNDEYDSYLYWQLNGKPRHFQEAKRKGMFTWDSSDNSYHGNSIAYDEKGNGRFIKPKKHDTVKYELDWYNKGLITEEGGVQRQMTPKEKAEWENFRKEYELVDDPERPNFYMYRRRHSNGGYLFPDVGSLGKITTYGQWQYPHQVTTIPSNSITMKGVNYPVIGVSNTGDTKYMLPNMDYLFEGQYVTEYPVHKFQYGGPDDPPSWYKPLTVAGTAPETSDNTRYVRPISDVEVDRASGLPEGTTTTRRIIQEQSYRQQPVIKQDNATTETHKSINKEVKKAQTAKKVNDVANTVAAVTSIPATVVAPEVMTPIFALQGFNDATDILSKEGSLNTEDYGRLGLDALFMLPMFNTAGNYLRYNTNLGRSYELSSALKKSIRNTEFNRNIDIPGQVGWAPKQTFTGYHASNESNFNPNFWYENWAVKTHDAPYGIYVAEGNAPESGFLAKRPFVHKVKVELEKPIVQVGEVQGKTKNGVRNQIERQAQKQGADALLFQDIKDNQLKHQNILKTLNPDTRILIDNNTNLMLNPNIQTPGLEADATRYIGLNEYDLRRLKEIADGDKILRSDISLLKYLNEGNEWDQSIDIRDIAKQELIEADKIKRAAKIIKNSTSNPKGENARKEVMEFFSSPEYQSRYKEIYSQNIGNKFRDISKTPFIQDINRATQNAEITEEVPIVLYQNKDQWIAQPSALGIRNGNKISVREGSPNEVYHHELFHISQNIAKRNKLNQDLNDIKVKPLVAKTQSKEIIKHYESIEEKRSRALSTLLEWQKKGYNINDKNEINKLVNNATKQGTTNANLAQLLKLFSIEDVKKMLEDMLILSPIMIKENSKN